jgi:O-antigen ligase
MSANFFNIKIKYLTSIKFLFYAFPFFMLMVSGYITAYVTVITFASLFFFYSNNIKIKLDLIDYFICLFFLSSLISTLINIKILGYYVFFKSILDLRFILFFLIIKNLIKFKLIDIKILLLTTLISTSFLSLDIIYQHINGQDLFQNKPFDGRYNGIFEHEAIAGSYIQKFFLLSLLFILLLNLNNKFIFLTIFINLLGSGILLSLDRMPFLIYLFTLIILMILLKKYRLILIINILIILTIFTLLFKNYDLIKNRYESLNNEINFDKISFFFKKIDNENTKVNITNEKILSGDYFKIYKSAYYLWLEDPIMGSGVKSFSINCNKLLTQKNNLTCSSHPHNIYLEITVNQGLVGLSIFIFLIFLLTNNFIKKIYVQNYKDEKIYYIVLFTILVVELWPLRSYGSIFQTVNGTLFWFLISLASSKLLINKN